MPDKYIIQRRTASGLETVAELPALENSKVDMSWLPVVGAMGSAIIERGSNANGEYIRWADGTQVCCMVNYVTPEQSAGSGGMFTFPAAFIDAPYVVVSILGMASGSNLGSYLVEIKRSSSGYEVKIQILQAGGSIFAVGNNTTFNGIAIGRWK